MTLKLFNSTNKESFRNSVDIFIYYFDTHLVIFVRPIYFGKIILVNMAITHFLDQENPWHRGL